MSTFANLQENTVYTVKLNTGETKQLSVFSKTSTTAHCNIHNHDGTRSTIIKELAEQITILESSNIPVINDNLNNSKTNLLYD